jgi:hypothetical protein
MLIFWRHRLTIPCFFGVLMLLGVILAGSAEPARPVGTDSGKGSLLPMPKVPAVSTFAPAEDLIYQAQEYVKDLNKLLADKADYEVFQEKIGKEANTMAVIALALGLHDQVHPYQPRAGAMLKAAQELAVTKDFAAAKAALAKLTDSMAGKGIHTTELKWEKVASLPELMKQVPTVNTKLKRNLKGERFKRKIKESAGYSAALAVIAQGAMPDLSPAKNTEQIREWYAFTEQMRNAAAEVNRAIHSGDRAAATETQKKLQKNCEDCHAVFKPDAVIEDQEGE